MSESNTVVLRTVLEKLKSESAPQMSEAEYFELFSAEQVLKSADLSYDEIEGGLVAGGGDGGIDAVYAFVNGELIAEDFDPSPHRQDVAVDLIVITAKTKTSFEEAAVDKLRTSSRDLLDFSKDLAEVAQLYNERLRAAIGGFREAYMALSGVFPRIRVRYYCVTQGDSQTVNPNVRTRAEALCAEVRQLLPEPDCVVEFLGASELLGLGRTSPVGAIDLPLVDAMSTGTGFVCLVKLSDYYRLITDDKGELRRAMLDANVRDYQGEIEVNRAIRETLGTAGGDDFWTLNNGVTILASDGAITGNVLKLRDPKIVNGLQTSVEIYRHYHARPEELDSESRHILVRVARTEDEAYRDRVIRATNTQTPIHPASLRATEPIHRNIEDFFKAHGLFYDRRKNFYKNQGKPKDKIVTIPHLAQAVMAILLREPDNSRARPSSLLKRDEEYARVFKVEYPPGMYVTCARIMRRVDDFLRSGQTALTQDEKTNLRFYVATLASREVVGAATPTPADLDGLDLSPLTDEVLTETVADLKQELQAYTADTRIPSDQAAKSVQFREKVLA